MADSVYNSVSCLYDALDLGNSGQWLEDGTLILNRPPASTKLDKLKFRSFSANIKNNIANITAPTLNCSLCCNFEILNQTTTSPDNITSDELSSEPKLLTSGGVSTAYTLNVLNQTGMKVYNNLYGTNTIKLSEFSIPLNLSVEDSISNGLRRAKIEFMKTFGLLADEAQDTDNFDYMSFQYGNYKLPISPSYEELEAKTNSVSGSCTISDVNYASIKCLDYINLFKSDDNGSLIKVGENQLFIYGSNEYNGIIYSLCNNNLTNYYSLPTEIGYINYSDGSYVKKLDLIEGSYSASDVYNKFVAASGNNGIILSTSIGKNNYSQNGFWFVAMSSVDAVSKPNYMCASATRIQMNPEEFKMFNYAYYYGQMYDTTTNFTNTFNACVSRGLPMTANLVKVDNFYYPGFTTVTVMIFAKFDSTEITFYFYAFTTTANFTSWVSNFSNCIYSTHTFTGDFYDVMTNGDQNIWNYYIDNMFGAPGTLNINLPGNQGVFVFTPTQGYIWCPASMYFADIPQTQITYNITSYACDGTIPNTEYYTFAISVQYLDNNSNYQTRSLYWKWVFNDSASVSNISIPSSGTPINTTSYSTVFNSYEQNDLNPAFNQAYISPVIINSGIYYYVYSPSAASSTIYPSTISVEPSGIRYTLSNSMISVDSWNGTFKPYLPTINEPGGSGYNWCNSTHISPENALSYQYVYYNANNDISNYLNTIFNWDINANTITFPNIPIYQQNGDTSTRYGVLLFYITFNTSPDVISFDPNIKQGIRSSCASYYSTYKQVLNQQPSLYINTYNFDPYFVILDESYYNALNTYLALRSTDQTLKLICDSYPTLNNIVFYLNETSMIDFKESTTSPMEPNIKCRIVDAAGATVTPTIAQQIYSNITICVDWQFYV